MKEIAKELSTMRDLMQWGVSNFNKAELCFAQGMPSSLDEAVYLCLWALNLPPDYDEQYFDCKLTLKQRLTVLETYQQRINKQPSAYITNEAWFAGLSFYVDKRVLIPRSPIAELIQNQFSPWIKTEDVHSILDLCTGSGCIAIACASVFDEVPVVASDISTAALEVADLNRKQHGMEDSLALIQSDLFSNLPSQRFDIIVSNPPYVSEAEVKALPEEFHEEPPMGLLAGDAGLDFVIPILREARSYLSDKGILVVEVGYTQDVLQQHFPQIPFLWLDFEHGGEGVFLLDADQLDEYQGVFDQAVLDYK